MLKDYWKYVENDKAVMKRFYDAVVESVEEMKVFDEKAYWTAFYTIRESIFGKHFDEELAKWAVSEMHNVDGSKGEHWNMAQTNQLLSSQGLKYNKYDFYYVMNMLHSDFSKVLGEDSKIYLEMAKAYISDPDADDTKVYCAWKARYM